MLQLNERQRFDTDTCGGLKGLVLGWGEGSVATSDDDDG